MSRQKVQPGAILDFLSPEEFLKGQQDFSESLLKALGKAAEFRRVIANAQVSGGNFETDFPVPDGFMWDIRALNVASPANVGKTFSAFFNDPNSPVSLVCQAVAGNTPAVINTKSQIMHSGDRLFITATGLAADNVTIQLNVVEVPLSHKSDLIL